MQLQVTQATGVEALKILHHLKDETKPHCTKKWYNSIFFLWILHFVWAAGRTSWSVGNHHMWLSKCQHSSHCETSQRDALLGGGAKTNKHVISYRLSSRYVLEEKSHQRLWFLGLRVTFVPLKVPISSNFPQYSLTSFSWGISPVVIH